MKALLGVPLVEVYLKIYLDVALLVLPGVLLIDLSEIFLRVLLYVRQEVPIRVPPEVSLFLDLFWKFLT